MNFYDDNDRYGPDAIELTRELEPLIRTIFNKYIEKGYKTRDIAYLCQDAVFINEIWARNSKEYRLRSFSNPVD